MFKNFGLSGVVDQSIREAVIVLLIGPVILAFVPVFRVRLTFRVNHDGMRLGGDNGLSVQSLGKRMLVVEMGMTTRTGFLQVIEDQDERRAKRHHAN